MLKKLLIGVGVMLMALTALGASDCGVETDTPTSEAPPAAEAPAAEAPAATPTVAPEPMIEDEACYLTASCPLTNGWTLDAWVAAANGGIAGFGEGNTPEAEALIGCQVDVVMLRMTVSEFLSLSDAEAANLLTDIFANECFLLFEAALGSADPQA